MKKFLFLLLFSTYNRTSCYHRLFTRHPVQLLLHKQVKEILFAQILLYSLRNTCFHSGPITISIRLAWLIDYSLTLIMAYMQFRRTAARGDLLSHSRKPWRGACSADERLKRAGPRSKFCFLAAEKRRTTHTNITLGGGNGPRTWNSYENLFARNDRHTRSAAFLFNRRLMDANFIRLATVSFKRRK